MIRRFFSKPSKTELGATVGGLLLCLSVVLEVWLLLASGFTPFGGTWVDLQPLKTPAMRGALNAALAGALVGLACACVVFPTFRHRWRWMVVAVLLPWLCDLAVPIY